MPQQKNQILSEEHLPDAELEIMGVLWRSDEPMKTADIHKALEKEKNWSISTVHALLARLTERGFVELEKRGRLKYYTPLVAKDNYQKKETKSFLRKFYQNSAKSLIATLVEEQAVRAAAAATTPRPLRNTRRENISDILHTSVRAGRALF